MTYRRIEGRQTGGGVRVLFLSDVGGNLPQRGNAICTFVDGVVVTVAIQGARLKRDRQ